MFYKLYHSQENNLLKEPESGMGYQIVEAIKEGSYSREKYLILNSEIVIELNGFEGKYVRQTVTEGIQSLKASASYISFQSIHFTNTILIRETMRNQSLKLSDNFVKILVNLPETGMGYQIVNVILKNGRVLRKHKVINSSLLMLEGNENLTVRDIDKIEME